MNESFAKPGKALNPSSPQSVALWVLLLLRQAQDDGGEEGNKKTFTQTQPKNAKMPTLVPASRWSPLGSAHRVTGWDEGI